VMADVMLFCGFCGKSQHEVRRLIAGPTVFICDECVELCTQILAVELPKYSNRIGTLADIGVKEIATWEVI